MIFTGTKFSDVFSKDNLSLAKSRDDKINVWGLTTTENQILTPKITEFKSFQEAIDKFSTLYKIYSMSLTDIFRTKELNPVMKTMAKAFNTSKNSDIKFQVQSMEDSTSSKYIYAHKWFINKTAVNQKSTSSNTYENFVYSQHKRFPANANEYAKELFKRYCSSAK